MIFDKIFRTSFLSFLRHVGTAPDTKSYLFQVTDQKI